MFSDKEMRRQMHLHNQKSLQIHRKVRTHFHTFNRSINDDGLPGRGEDGEGLPQNHGLFGEMAAFQNTSPSFLGVVTNSLLMEIIVNHLPVKGLLDCRLVCKHWAREMIQHLTKRKALVVSEEDCSEARELIEKKEQGKIVNLSALCIVEIPLASPIIRNIIRNFGETLSGLKLDGCHSKARDLFKLLQRTPSLEVLSFRQARVREDNLPEADDEHDHGGEIEEIPQVFQQAVGRRARRINGIGDPWWNPQSKLDGLTDFCDQLIMPTVRKLVWEEMDIIPVSHVERILTMFPCLEELKLLCYWAKPDPETMKGLKMEHLQKLTISSSEILTDEHFLVLANLRLKLKKLTLNVLKTGGWKKSRGFKLFLESIAPTLEEIRLTGSGRLCSQKSSPFPVEFPNLHNLEIESKLLMDLKWLDGMPKLQNLECKMEDWKEWWNLMNRNGMPKLHNQELGSLILGAIDGGCLRRMVPCFTQVTKLYVYEDRIDDAAFRTICQVMQQLSHLKIEQNCLRRIREDVGTGVPGRRVGSSKMLRMTDSGITGMDDETCKKLRERLLEVEVDQEEINKRRTNAYIGNLTGLKCLELSMSDTNISDVGVIYGIATLPKIVTITLRKCELTDASLKVLVDMSSLVILGLYKSCGVSLETIQAFKEKNKNLHINLY